MSKVYRPASIDWRDNGYMQVCCLIILKLCNSLKIFKFGFANFGLVRSYVLTGTDKGMATTFGSTCHGAGRAMSRAKSRWVEHFVPKHLFLASIGSNTSGDSWIINLS